MTTDESPRPVLRASKVTRVPRGNEVRNVMWDLVREVAATSAVVIFTGGESKETWIRQLLSVAAYVPIMNPNQHLIAGQLAVLQVVANRINKLPIYISESLLDETSIAQCQRMLQQPALGLVVGNIVDGVDETVALRVAQQLGVPILLVEQEWSQPPIHQHPCDLSDTEQIGRIVDEVLDSPFVIKSKSYGRRNDRMKPRRNMYPEAQQAFAAQLQQIAKQLLDRIIHYEMKHDWREWDVLQPVGAQCVISPDDFIDSPTPFVPDLVQLYKQLEIIHQQLEEAAFGEEINRMVDDVFQGLEL